jgi:hypothetical protein
MVAQDNLLKERVQKHGQVSQNKVQKKVESAYISAYYKLSFTAAYQRSNTGMIVNL